MTRLISVGLNAVILAVTDEVPRILTMRSGREGSDPAIQGHDALPFGPLDPDGHRTLELGLRDWVRNQTGLELGYVEQLYTFGDRERDPVGRAGERRLLSIGYLALVHELQVSGGGGAAWREVYDFFPWEDWRAGRPVLIDRVIGSGLDAWVAEAADSEARRSRQERSDIAFGRGGAPWDPYKVLQRYELLYEAGRVAEAERDLERRVEPPASAGASAGRPARSRPTLGRPMALDHRRIVATALARIRGKLKFRPVVFELLPETFTLLRLQRVVEALAGVRLHKQNFRRLVERGGLVEGTGRLETHTGGRPAELFRFRREVLRERPAPGVGLPGLRIPS